MIHLFLGNEVATSAALGTALRAAGYGLKVQVCMLGNNTVGPLLTQAVLDRLPNISQNIVRTDATVEFIERLGSTEKEGKFDLLVLCWISAPLTGDPVEKQVLMNLLDTHKLASVILSAPSADESWIEMADLVTNCECPNTK
ncbi:MAG: cob(I)yrinic acid a,c-diamide adenosyltransferase [Dehalogenimonas sp.]